MNYSAAVQSGWSPEGIIKTARSGADGKINADKIDIFVTANDIRMGEQI